MKKISEGRHRIRTPLLVIFSFLLGCMLTTNLTPIDKTCRIEDTDKEYNIMKNSKLKNPELIVLILSAPKNLDKRDTIRETWLKLYKKNTENYDQDQFKIKHYFVIGSLDLSADQLLHLSSEQSKFNDILILPMHDSYKNLTEKVKRSFEWLNEQYDYGLGFKYVLKCDDDSFVNLKKLVTELMDIENAFLHSNLQYSLKLAADKTKPFLSVNAQVNDKSTRENNLQLYWGYFSGTARIKTKGKWKENNWISSDRYVPYALGGGYIISKELVTYIANNADSLRSFMSEDVSVGLWLAPINNIVRIHDTRFDTEWISRGCRNSHLITHNISPDDMRGMFKNLMELRILCSEEVDKRSYYVYDWSVPPSQCCKPFDESIFRLQKH